ncbi:hypothetical protein BDN72DRAFT_834674 [Pluteus cervinus]|uniref:Uncharacterized protein n=1 Tax=Pluteus cervinus TaxID=181527 RepID=A0ACD3B7A7_9AGAR|nr:hypothetical protein BDN72DRAFT_834674 [Pluteus cervinus]
MTLPPELIWHILSYLSVPDLITCSAISTKFAKIINESSRFQYLIELAKSRMVSTLPASAHPPSQTRLNILREREKSWRYLRWKGRHRLKLPPTGSVYEFVGGLYGNGREDEQRVTASVSFVELPNSLDMPRVNEDGSVDLKMWTHCMGDIQILDFTMDPAQDLLVLVALAPPQSKYVYELHLRSLSTNEPHPRAPSPVLACLLRADLPLPSIDVLAAIRVQVSGSLIAFLVKEDHGDRGAHMEIWNWENSPQNSCQMARLSGIDDFTMLSHNTFLLVRPSGRFEVYTFQDPANGSNCPISRASYAFPPLSDGYAYWYITMSSNPPPGYVPNAHNTFPGNNSSDNQQIYYPRPDERIHACCVYISNPNREDNTQVYSFVFFLNIKTFLNPPEEWFQRTPTHARSSRRHPVRIQRDGSSSNSSSGSSGSASSSRSSSSTPPSSTSSVVDLSTLLTPSSTLPVLAPSAPTPGGNPATLEFPWSDTLEYITTSVGTAYQATSLSFNPVLPPTEQHRRRRGGSARFKLPSTQTTHVPWEVWGPQNTRWFEESLSTDWQHAIYGLRTVECVRLTKEEVALANILSGEASSTSHAHTSLNGTVAPTPHTTNSAAATTSLVDSFEDRRQPPEALRYLRLRDFNAHAVAEAYDALDQDNPFITDGPSVSTSNGKGKAKDDPRWHTPRVVVGPSVTPTHGVFQEDIVSSLPYTEVSTKEVFDITDVMMDDCRLLLLKRGNLGRLKTVDVLTM